MLRKYGVCRVKGRKKLYAFHLLCFYAFHLVFFLKRLLSNLSTFRLRPVWVYFRGRFGTLFTPGVKRFYGDIQSSIVIGESSFWVFSGVIDTFLWSYVISQVLQWREKYIVCFIWCLIANLLFTLLLYNSNTRRV